MNSARETSSGCNGCELDSTEGQASSLNRTGPGEPSSTSTTGRRSAVVIRGADLPPGIAWMDDGETVWLK